MKSKVLLSNNKIKCFVLPLNYPSKSRDCTRIATKAEEFASKEEFWKTLEGKQMALESETKGKVEALCMKTKFKLMLLTLMLLLSMPMQQMQKARGTSKGSKTISGIFRLNMKMKSGPEKLLRTIIAADRRANANQNAVEEGITLLKQSDKNRRMIEQEIADSNEIISY